MKVLVTGSSGHVGGVIAAHLHAAGHAVVGMSRRAAAAPYPVVDADLAAADFRKRLAGQVDGFDAVVHAAAALDKSFGSASIIMTNCVGTQSLIDLAWSWQAARFVYISGVAVIGRPRFLPIDEEHPEHPETTYHVSKLFGEHLVSVASRAGLSGVSLRLTAPVGPGLASDRVLSIFVARALAGEPLTLLGRGGRRQNYVDVRDVALAVEASLPARVGGVVNIAAPSAVSNRGLAEACIDVLDSRSSIEFAGEDPDEDVNWDVSIERARAELGFSPRYDLHDSIRAVAEGHASRARR